jgi:hypothetical protein
VCVAAAGAESAGRRSPVDKHGEQRRRRERFVRDDEHPAGGPAPQARPDPRRRVAAHSGPALGTDGRQHAAVEDRRGAPPEHKTVADLYRPEWETYTGFSRRRAEKAEWPATICPRWSGRSRRRHGRAHGRGASAAVVHRRSGEDGDHRQEPRSDLDGGRRLGVHRSAEHDAGLPGEGWAAPSPRCTACEPEVKAVLDIRPTGPRWPCCRSAIRWARTRLDQSSGPGPTGVDDAFGVTGRADAHHSGRCTTTTRSAHRSRTS